MADLPQTDVSRPAALPTANLGLRTTQHKVGEGSNEYLDKIEAEWNAKVDVEIQTLADGMVDLVNLASIKDKDKVRVAQEAFQAQFRAESMVRAANSLLSIIHSMKLLLLLSDQAQIVSRRDAELLETEKDKDEIKKKVAEVLNDLLQHSGEGPSSV
ncbi:hypothetical protein K488DRAFT_45911 [Vararia minispora EC-137]|uniref:Uncharacterized protein n=1 Tax=Vararia minispora EC-137 TaxID=1314806 RepID=A0ACB8QQR4_9AGAM|nr:hypothetical protein K488DRAFT_45911 [Vararia minispora EC-137]